jgi:putative endonuclease
LGERLARRYLESRGCTVLGQNVRLGRHDEVDLIVRDGRTTVFVEVKARSSDRFGTPEASVTARKRRSIERAIAAYLRRHPTVQDFRFDVIAVSWPRADGRATLRHFRSVGEGSSLAFP